MNLIEAIKSKKGFRSTTFRSGDPRPYIGPFNLNTDGDALFSLNKVLDDYELEEETVTITKEQLNSAVIETSKKPTEYLFQIMLYALAKQLGYKEWK